MNTGHVYTKQGNKEHVGVTKHGKKVHGRDTIMEMEVQSPTSLKWKCKPFADMGDCDSVSMTVSLHVHVPYFHALYTSDQYPNMLLQCSAHKFIKS